MTNKWQIALDVNLIEKETLVRLLDAEVAEVSRLQEGWEDFSEQITSLEQLRNQIVLAWIEREVEIIPPPSKWSAHSPVAVDSDVYRG